MCTLPSGFVSYFHHFEIGTGSPFWNLIDALSVIELWKIKTVWKKFGATNFHWPTILATNFREFHWQSQKYDAIFLRWRHLKYLAWFYKRGKWSVKLAINLSYFCNHFCKTNCNRRSRKYFVSVTRVTQIIWLNLMDAYKFWRYTLIFLFKLPTQI